MDFISVSKNDGIATITLSRGKVNALNEIMVEQLNDCFTELETDRKTDSVILTGRGKFFSFGFDIPEFMGYSKEDFIRYLTKFTGLYTRIFLFPKPVIAALNGHTIAGGCMLATACDYRVMVSDRSKISLNEINFGSSVFAGYAEMLGFCVGWKNAETILYNGAMYSGDRALQLGLIDMVSSRDDLMNEADKKARDLGGKDNSAFSSIKGLLRKPVAERMVRREKKSIQEFVNIWYSEKTWEELKKIGIKI
ncbi:MAG: enoyl-CoA hydratase/isomerase family protein [Proteobacteria bacterium]|nr:enoyl-CoA hydratase/isomerase family protein [Pseudomonadota bacterium]MBU1585901.1 enoyl-CoA hydratase/isomerase family protein [Pseudomonadota bacterium]MBU2453424.1 enoyl-CoA hydratase/isomerase family protein [Pseudomonadota bacterium]MBU2627195.1 enoyl-CoA hydratase/isomerase family protein [Pseudomonadota bacterium]